MREYTLCTLLFYLRYVQYLVSRLKYKHLVGHKMKHDDGKSVIKQQVLQMAQRCKLYKNSELTILQCHIIFT